MILVLRDEDKWAASVHKHLKVEREQFKEMMWWRLHGGIYRWIFNHSSRAMGLYMDWIRPLLIGPEARNFYGENMDILRMKYRFVKNSCGHRQIKIDQFYLVKLLATLGGDLKTMFLGCTTNTS